MKRLICSLPLIFSAIAGARDAAQLKADLVSMLPAGKTEMRLAWIKGGGFTEFAWEAAGGGQMAVYAVSSADGNIRRLYPASGGGQYCNVNVSANGQRVFFCNRASERLCVINWDGSGFKEVNVGGVPWEYWCDPADGSDWVIVSKNGVSRVKVDAPTTSVQICNGNYAGDGCGLTDDGKSFFGYTYDKPTVAYSMCSATSPFAWTYGPHGGCQGSLSAGASPKYNHNPKGHTQMCVHDAKDQTKFTVYETSQATSAWLTQIGQKLPSCQNFVSNEGARFTQYPDYATYCISQSKVNPILVKLGNPLKMIYIEDNLSCTFCGDMDVAFLPYTGIPGATETVRPAGRTRAAICATDADVVRYAVDGRRLRSASRSSLRHAATQGVVVRRVGGRAAAIIIDVE